MRRRLTIAEREELAAERARRQQELLDEAAALRQSIAERAQVCARLAQRDRRRPVRERIGAQVERLSAAQLALDLALRLLPLCALRSDLVQGRHGGWEPLQLPHPPRTHR